MTFVVTESCIKCKYTDCVEVCPVDCFYEGENMLVINPDECIDCELCKPACPAKAIFSDKEPEAHPWIELNKEYSAIWPNIACKADPLPQAEAYQETPDKFNLYFSKEPAQR